MKKVLSALIVAVMLVGMLPAIAIPAFAEVTSGTTGDCTWTLNGTELTISGNGAMEDEEYDYVHMGVSLPWGESITKVTIEEGVTSIGNYVFYGCTGLTSITIGDEVTSIGDYAFRGCTGLTSITIPDKVTSIGDYAFFGCAGLSSIVLSNSVTSIGNDVFYDCSSLISVAIPKSITSIGCRVFVGCSSLVEFSVASDNPNYFSKDGMLFNKNQTLLIAVPLGNTRSSYVIPNSVTSIGDYAFMDCAGLSSVTIPDSVTSIGYSAFNGCLKLTSIIIPDSVTSIGDYAFSGCTGLTSIIIPDKVTSIGQGIFYNCDNLTSVTIPDGVTSIGSYAFGWSSGLTSVIIGDNVDSIGMYAFVRCINLSSITFGKDVTSIGEGTFKDCTNLKDVYYLGTQEEFESILIQEDNEPLTSATIHYHQHTYDNACDTTCDCGYTRSVVGHKYSNACDKDCNICKATRTPAAHKGGIATCKEKAKCSVCGAAYGNLADHKFGGYVYNNDATSQKDGTQTRTCSICQKTETVTATGTKLENPFKDVKLDQYYGEPVLWAVGKKITNGMTTDSFAPNNECTRGQIVTFLWRAAGSPKPKSTKNPFRDVQEGAYYYDAVLWAVEKGITTGTSANTFSPDAGCTRGQVVTFLHRAKSKPAASGSNAFSDVKAGAYYYDAVRWAVKNEITNGTGDNKFAPDNTCTRGQIVTFLYRAYN